MEKYHKLWEKREYRLFITFSSSIFMSPSGFLGNLNKWILDDMGMVRKLLSMKQGNITVDITELEMLMIYVQLHSLQERPQHH